MTIIPFPTGGKRITTKVVLCPYHIDLTPTLIINYFMDRFRCTVCKETGNIAKLSKKLQEKKS